jgi:hypothetical protein
MAKMMAVGLGYIGRARLPFAQSAALIEHKTVGL